MAISGSTEPGLMTVHGRFYPETEAAVRTISDHLYVHATSKG